MWEKKNNWKCRRIRKESLKKFSEYDLHRPWIDDIKIKMQMWKRMKRIPDVIDCWYDSGSATFAQIPIIHLK